MTGPSETGPSETGPAAEPPEAGEAAAPSTTTSGAVGPGGPGLEVTVPTGLVDAVLHLVSTGSVPLGGYTLAEMVAVDAVVDFLEEPPSEEVVGEAVRSLAARQLLMVQPGSQRLQVRGDLGIALVFQQRARLVVDARVTGTEPGQPWRTLLLPQPEGVALEVLISALGVHELSLHQTDEAFGRLQRRLPDGDPAPVGATADQVLEAAGRTALVTVTRYHSDGTAEGAELSTDVVLAEQDGRLHVFVRDVADPERLAPQRLGSDEALQLIRGLSVPAPVGNAGGPPQDEPAPTEDDAPGRRAALLRGARQQTAGLWRRLRQLRSR